MSNISRLLTAKLAMAALILTAGAAVSTAAYTAAQHAPASTSATGGVNNNPGPNSASPAPSSV